MSGRGRMPPRYAGARREYYDVPEGPIVRGPARPHPRILEEEFERQQVEFRRLMADQRALAEDRLALQRELSGAKEELRRLNMIMSDIRAEKETYIRELIDKGRKLEADLRSIEPLKNEAIHLRTQMEKLVAARQELAVKVQALTRDLERAKSDNQQIIMMRNEIDTLRQELTHARAAIEFERKGNMELVAQRQAMENNMVSMAREIEKLRAELSTTEARTWAAGGAYGNKTSSGSIYSTSYGENYSLDAGVPEKGPVYGSGSGSWGAYEKNRLGRQ